MSAGNALKWLIMEPQKDKVNYNVVDFSKQK